jgi:hypothetical protein
MDDKKQLSLEKKKFFFVNKKIYDIKLSDSLYLERKSKFDPSRELIIKSLEIIKTQWNKDLKSRNFIKHLIGNFIPINLFNKLTTTKYEPDPESSNVKILIAKCAILGIKLIGTDDLIEKMKIIDPIIEKIKVIREIQTPGISDSEEFDKLTEELETTINKMPVEFKEYSIAYYSLNSNKHLSIHALYALNYFVEQALFLGDKDVQFTVTKVRLMDNQIVKNSHISKTELNSIAKVSSFGVKNHHLSEKTYIALEKLKIELKNKNNHSLYE